MVVVELMDGAGQLTPVPVGETTLGRGDMLGNSDKRLSRKQVCEWWRSGVISDAIVIDSVICVDIMNGMNVVSGVQVVML